MRALDYAFRQGWLSLWRARGATGFAVVAIALALIVLGALLMLTWNTQRVLARLTDAAEFSVYLRDDATSEQRGAVEAAIDASGVMSGREYVSKQEAETRFRRQHPDLANLSDGLEGDPFPASIEVRLNTNAAQDERIAGLVRTVTAMPGVDDVRYDREWLSRFSAGLRAVGAAGLTLAFVMAIAAAVTVAAVVRLGLQSRQEEIEIMELVGAPLTFIRGPFVAEGLLQGGIGAAVALAALWVGFLVARGWWGEALSAALNGAALEFLPLRTCAGLLLGGMAVGAAGGFAAARHAGFANMTSR
ncbi:MAG TPA: permease-like cell division protein FtsX [Vicinamibacterales bacterium]|nr:permease-like cell division protein FtsX [Vicinamibacterales bacterium]